MGTENYTLADRSKTTKKLTFNRMPINLMVDRNATFLNRPEIKKNLSESKVKDVKVEYFLSRWKVN